MSPSFIKKGIHMKKISTAAIAALALLSLPALAKEGGKDPFAVCRADMQKFCGDVKPGEGRQVKCMMDNRSRVSGECGEILNKKAKHEQEMREGKQNKVKHEQDGKPNKVKH